MCYFTRVIPVDYRADDTCATVHVRYATTDRHACALPTRGHTRPRVHRAGRPVNNLRVRRELYYTRHSVVVLEWPKIDFLTIIFLFYSGLPTPLTSTQLKRCGVFWSDGCMITKGSLRMFSLCLNASWRRGMEQVLRY